MAKGKRFRLAVRGLAVLVVVLMIVAYVLARTSLTRTIVLPHIERLILAEAQADKVLVGLDGNIRMTNLRITVPGVEGEAAELLVARRVVVHVNWGARIRGGPTVRKIEMRHPLLRISQDVQTGEVTLSQLPAPDDDDDTSLELPEIVCVKGTIELGEHEGDEYRRLRTMTVDGTLSPAVDEAEAYLVSIRELPDSPTWRGDGMSIAGRYNEESFDLRVSGVALSDWPSTSLPSRIRPIFEALQLDGEVSRTLFHIQKNGDFEATLELDDVSLDLPFDSAGRFQNAGDHLRMTRVDGTITVSNHEFLVADLSGVVEDLPYEVEFRYEGMSPDSPFSCELHTRGFQLDREPRLLPLAPRIVHRRLESFSYPTMLIDFDVSISRTGADIDVEGDIRFTEGVASYEDFPYPFEGLEGHVTFNAEEVRIHEVSGRSPTGARVRASGWIAPPVDGAAAKLQIDVEDIPFDRTLLDGLSPARRELIEALFSRTQADVLGADGLIQSEAQKESHEAALSDARRDLRRLVDEGASAETIRATQDEIDRLAIRRALPVFEPGGLARASITLDRELGKETDWTKDVRVTLDDAGLLASAFPYPIMAQDLEIRIDEVVRLSAASFTGLGGGRAELEATASLAIDGPLDIRINAFDVPVDEHLIHALPEMNAVEGSEFNLRRALRALRIGGTVDAKAAIQRRDGGEIGFDVLVEADRLVASPGRVAVDEARAMIEVNERAFSINLEGLLRESRRTVGNVLVRANATYGDDFRFESEIETTHVDVASPVEDVVRIFSEPASEALRTMRARFAPSGRLDALTKVGLAEQVVSLDVTVPQVESLEVDTELGRLSITTEEGDLRFRPRTFLAFDDVRGTLGVDGEPHTDVSLDGVFGFEGAQATDLHAELRSGRFESLLTERAVEQFVGAEPAALLADHDPRGTYTIEIDLESDDVGGYDVQGVLQPHAIDFTRRDTLVRLPRVEGAIRFSDDAGTFAGISAHGIDWTLDLEGSWRRFGADELAIDLRTAIEAPSLLPEIRALLPVRLDEVRASIELEVDGPVTVPEAVFQLRRSNGLWDVRSEGLVEFANASALIGVQVTDAMGEASFQVESLGDRAPTYDVAILGSSARASAIELTDARIRLRSGLEPRSLLVPLISADCHGGRLAGAAHVTPRGEEADYQLDLRASGIGFASVLGNFRDDVVAPADTRSRGVIDGELSLSGTVLDPASRRGRGSVLVGGGAVMTMPLMLPLIQFSNLQVPGSSELDLATASFFIEGEQVTFELLSAFASDVEIFGFGTMGLPDYELDLRLNSRAVHPVPVLSRLLEGLRDELITTRVQGTLGAPAIDTIPFRGARRLVDRLFGVDESRADRVLRDIERRAISNRNRTRGIGGRDRSTSKGTHGTSSTGTESAGID